MRKAIRSVSASEPRQHFGRSSHLSAVNGGEMEHEGSGGSGGSAGLLQQILSLKLVPRVGNGTLCPNSTSLCSFPGTGPAPCRACALRALAPPPGRGAPLPQPAGGQTERGLFLRPPVPPSRGCFPPGRRFPLPRRDAGGYKPSPVASSPAPRVSHCDPALGARAEGVAASGRVSGGSSATSRTILLLEFPDTPRSDWDPKESRKRSPLLVWGAMRLASEVRAGLARLSRLGRRTVPGGLRGRTQRLRSRSFGV